MEGNRRIELLGTGGRRDKVGGISFKDYAVVKVLYGIRRDRGGREVLADGTFSGEWQARYEVRWESGLHELQMLRDEDGGLWDIVAINEVPGMPYQSKLWLYCTRRGKG